MWTSIHPTHLRNADGTVVGERGSVLECASPLALSTREPHAGPNASFFRIPFPARAAEDCRTPGPARHSISGFNVNGSPLENRPQILSQAARSGGNCNMYRPDNPRRSYFVGRCHNWSE